MGDKLEDLKNVFSGSNCTLIACHDYPDPDCLASAAGMQVLLKSWKIKSVITYGGFVGRAENRAMIQHLDINALPISGLDLDDFDRVFFIDTQPDAGNHSLPPEVRRDAVIDHHSELPGSIELPYCDVQENAGATSSIITEYLRKAKLELSYKICTALYYGIKSDTQDLGREATMMDREVYHYLFTRVDHKLLTSIEHPSLYPDFFRTVMQAIEGLELHGRCGWCYLDRITRPDLVAEIADLLVRIDGLDWVICLGYLKNILYFSIRSANVDKEAAHIARLLVKGEDGSAGGHGQISAGRIRNPMPDEELLARIHERYLSGLEISEITPDKYYQTITNPV